MLFQNRCERSIHLRTVTDIKLHRAGLQPFLVQVSGQRLGPLQLVVGM